MDILKDYQSEILDDINYINVNRNKILDGALRAQNRSTFNPFNRLSIKFSDDSGISEGAVDSGGPTKEFLRLVVRGIVESSIFEGSKEKKYLAKNNTGKPQDIWYIRLKTKDFFIVHIDLLTSITKITICKI